MPADLQDKWRDEDGPPSPQQELEGDWWEKPQAPQTTGTYPHDHGEYLHELYAEIMTLRALVKELQAQSTTE